MTSGKTKMLTRLYHLLRQQQWTVCVATGPDEKKITNRDGTECVSCVGNGRRRALLVDEVHFCLELVKSSTKFDLIIAAGLPLNGVDVMTWDKAVVLEPGRCQQCGRSQRSQGKRLKFHQIFTHLGEGPPLDFRTTEVALFGQHKWRTVCGHCMGTMAHRGENIMEFAPTWYVTSSALALVEFEKFILTVCNCQQSCKKLVWCVMLNPQFLLQYSHRSQMLGSLTIQSLNLCITGTSFVAWMFH